MLQAGFSRRFTTAPEPPKKSNLGLYLAGAGAAGLGAYVYLQSSDKAAALKPVQEKSPLNPDAFLDFKLKKVEPYNHNTSK